MSYQKFIALGNLGNDVELIETQSGMNIGKFSLATNQRVKSSDGEYVNKASWHRCVAFGKTAEIIAQYVKKGDQFNLDGRAEYGSYENKEGVKVYTTEIIVEKFSFVKGGGSNPQNAGQTSVPRVAPSNTIAEFVEGDLPF